MKNLHKAAAVSTVAGSLAVLGADVASATTGGGYASGAATNSSGFGSGNLVQAPVNASVNTCGNTFTVTGGPNSAAANVCTNK